MLASQPKKLCMQLLRNNVFVLTRLPHSCRETAGGSPPAAAIRKAPSTTKRFTRMSTWWPLLPKHLINARGLFSPF